MIPQFEGLNTEEQQLMCDAIPLITVYIAGADGHIDEEEKEWAEKVTKIRSYSYHHTLQGFYEKVEENFNERLHHFIDTFPDDVDKRTAEIGEILAGLNSVLPKLDVNIAARYYKTLLSFAKHVARASGGFLGIGSISHEEERLLGLEMIEPIIVIEEEEEEENE